MSRKSFLSFRGLSFRTALAVRNLVLLVLVLACTRIVMLAQATASSRILSPPSSYHFPEDQKFVYSVQLHMLNAGTTTILIQHSAAGEHLHSTADTSGVTNKLFPVHDTFDAEVNPTTFCTQWVTRHAEEGSRRLDRKIRLNYAAAKVLVDDFDLKTGKAKHGEFDIPGCVTDIVSGFFYASSLSLTPGQAEIFPVNDGGKTSDVKIEVEGRGKIKVPIGEFQTIRVKAEPITGPLKGKGRLWVWFTDDPKHTPVQMRSKLGFASLLFQLQRIDKSQ